jgi:hypothetical protein
MRIRVIVLTTMIFIAGTGIWLFAQILEQRAVQPPITVMGDNVGFRIEAYKGQTVLGTLVVRVNGKWVDAQPVAGGGSSLPGY